MKTSGDLGSSHKKRSSYFFIAFFVIAILSMAIEQTPKAFIIKNPFLAG